MTQKERRKQEEKRQNFQDNSSDAMGMFIEERTREGKRNKRGKEGLKCASCSLATAIA
jgi:hypothetical protein